MLENFTLDLTAEERQAEYWLTEGSTSIVTRYGVTYLMST